jgi:hypothetical protein
VGDSQCARNLLATVDAFHKEPLIARKAKQALNSLRFFFFMLDEYKYDLACRHCFAPTSRAAIFWPCGHMFCQYCQMGRTLEDHTAYCSECRAVKRKVLVVNEVQSSLAALLCRSFAESNAQLAALAEDMRVAVARAVERSPDLSVPVAEDLAPATEEPPSSL